MDAPARRITTWLAIFGYTLVASGLPLPLGGAAVDVRDSAASRRLSAKDRSRPFPCMDRPCGCDTADRCFTTCCCLAPSETLAWARAHDVEPGVLAALERRLSGDSQPSVTTHGSVPTPKSSCCSTTAPRAEAPCCVTMPSGCGDEDVAMENRSEPPAEGEPSPRPRSRPVTLRAMLACGGILAGWFVAGAALPPPRIEVLFVMLPVDETIVADAVGAGLRTAPDAPPPRAA